MSTGRTVVVQFALFFLYSFITARQQSDTLKPLRRFAQHRQTATDREAIPTMNRYANFIQPPFQLFFPAFCSMLCSTVTFKYYIFFLLNCNIF